MGLTSGPVRSPHATLLAAFPAPSQHLKKKATKDRTATLQSGCSKTTLEHRSSTSTLPKPKKTTTLSVHEPNCSLCHSHPGNTLSRQAGETLHQLQATGCSPLPSSLLSPSGRSSPAPGPQDSPEGLSSPKREAVSSQHSGTEPTPPMDLLPAQRTGSAVRLVPALCSSRFLSGPQAADSPAPLTTGLPEGHA